MKHIGKKIREIFEESGMTVTEFARRIKNTRQNVYGIFERESIDTALLERIGKALNYDFFQHYTKHNVSNELIEELIQELKKRELRLCSKRSRAMPTRKQYAEFHYGRKPAWTGKWVLTFMGRVEAGPADYAVCKAALNKKLQIAGNKKYEHLYKIQPAK